MLLIETVNYVFDFLFWFFILSCVLSIIDPYSNNPLFSFVRDLTDPVFSFLRNLFPFLVFGAIDFSPALVLVIVAVLQSFVNKFLISVLM